MKVGVINSVFVLNNSCSGKLSVSEWLWGMDESRCGCMYRAEWPGGERQCHFQCVLGWGRSGMVMARGWMMTTLGWYGIFSRMGKSINLSARLACLSSLSSQCSLMFLWVSAVWRHCRLNVMRLELVSLQNQDWKDALMIQLAYPGYSDVLYLFSKLSSFFQIPKMLFAPPSLYFSKFLILLFG